MAKIISVNAGSSSLKFQLFEMPQETVLTSGIVERIGLSEGIFTIKVNGEKITKTLEIKDHNVGVKLLLEALIDYKIVESLDEIKGTGHRVVQGGSYFDKSVIATEDVVEKVDSLCSLAPLHNFAHLIGLRAFKKVLPNATHVFVFDTAFHQTMEPEIFLYPIPYDYYTEHKVRKYGAHGTSHKYVAYRCAELMNKNIEDVNIITCHLGNGASLSAVKGGKCVNTSMGFTPLGGIMMGTRSGDLDPAVIGYLSEQLHVTGSEVVTMMNKRSGMLGISGISSDARDIDDAVQAGNERAILTRKMYANRIANFIGAYVMQLRRVDAIVFTAGLGENDTAVRLEVINEVKDALNIVLDEKLNAASRGKEIKLSTDESAIEVWVVPTNEELCIARDTYNLM
ncbi:MAG: acetate kinase [Erysipelotrichaceae bacterium]